ncbi:hypothetical protein Cgig2_025288 [Carnegiea gigantea]|uniref:rhamnogalacturonan endolyase n=1 Tax=Carnegiea gigantea TaxID=171969 RepID=A0A9Q1KAT9_9CARY|nr:hypothetical protein Cgig2_025288 [Carnegiea gigantea]
MSISNPDGIITKVTYNGIENLLEETDKEENRGYWDLYWSEVGTPGTTGYYDRIIATSFKVIVEDEEMVEVSFTRTWDASLEGKLVPLNIDKRFIVLRGSSGFYCYGIYEKLKEWPGFNLPQIRIVFKLSKHWFRYMVVADNRQRNMPLPDDREPDRCQVLDFPEAVLLTNPIEEEFKGEVDDKYEYSCEDKELQVHGWICMDPPTGFWQITPSDEFRTGGPLKQNLTSHVGPFNLAMFTSAHYAGEDMVAKFADGEPWKRVFGPVFMYINSVPKEVDWHWLWEDAKEQRIMYHQGYQFWTKTDEDGYFIINNIRAGDYNLYASVPGFIGDYMCDNIISITPGCEAKIGDLVYEPPRDGPTLWEIGIPDRTAREFYIPDPNPKYINKLYINHPDRFRQYGLWERYAELYPDEDLVYMIGVSDYRKDWFFAQVTRKKGDMYQGTTWKIKFKLDDVSQSGVYKLRLALATAHLAELQVRVNDPTIDPPIFTTGLVGKDNAIARHGIHGLYRLYTADIQGSKLVIGDNTIFLTQAMGGSPVVGIMYDYIRLEAPSDSN